MTMTTRNNALSLTQPETPSKLPNYMTTEELALYGFVLLSATVAKYKHGGLSYRT